MPWKPLTSVLFAVAVYPFKATQPDDLPLQVGDCLYIIEQGGSDGEWYRGYLVGFPSLLAGLTSAKGRQLDARVFTGVFPRNCVEEREVMDDGKQNGTSDAAHEDVGGNGMEMRERRKSQAEYARRLSRALSRKRSIHDITKKAPTRLIPDEPVPRLPNAPKPPAPVPTLRVGDETGLSAQEPLVDEIASCLREWHDARLHELILARGYSQLARVADLIKRVDISRKQLMHDVMTLKELNKLREDTVWDLVAGNKMLSDEVIVRSPTEKGRILTAEDSVIEMTKLQANMSILDRPPKASVDKHMLYHVLVDVRNLVCESTEAATVQMYLCTKEFGEKPRPLSENYAISIPLPQGPAQTPEEDTKTLFVNLSPADIGLGSDTSSLYVVFKLLKEEPVRQQLSGQTYLANQANTSTSTTSNAQKHGSMRGRRSVFGSQRKKDGHQRNTSESTSRPDTAASELSEAQRSSESTSEPPASAEIKTVKRTVGVGAIDIGSLARNQSELERHVTMWSPSQPQDDRGDENEDWLEVVRELIRSPTGSFSRVDLVKRFDIFVTAFASADLDGLVRNTPTLLHNVHMTEKLGFSGVPSHKRSDIYLTLTEPLVPRNAHLAHSKFGNVPLTQRCQSILANLQLTLEVRRADGERIDDCIFTASNHQGHTAWRTTGVERGEGWNQTIKLAVPPEDVPGSHIVMSIADSPNFPFALAWVPLWEGDAFVRDGDHSVALYVYDEYSSSIVGGRGAYLALPPWQDKRDTASANAATVSLRTYLCSTEYSQDPTLLGLLEWRNLYGSKLIELLERFAFVPEIEIVKLLSEVFAALFEVLHEYAQNEDYEDIIFYNLVVVLSIARDRRFNLHNVIEDYAQTRHDWPYASKCLMSAYHRLVTNPLDPEASRKLRATLKVGDYMLKLIIETSKRPPPSHDEDGMVNGDAKERHPELVHDLQKLFVALMALMRNRMPVLLGTQTLVIQHFHTWLPELGSLMGPTDIMEIATNLLDACANAQGKMILYRLILIINYSHLDIFKPAEIRTTLIANTFRWLAPYWGDAPEVTEQWHNQVRLCCSVVAAQMEELGEESCQYVPKLVESYTVLQKETRPPKRTFSMLFPTTYPFPFKSTPVETLVDEAMLEISALLAAALSSQNRLYFDANQIDIPGVLLQALKVGQSVLGCEAFPRSWLSLHVSHHRFAMTALERISEVLVDTLPDVFAPDEAEAIDFDTGIWRTFFDTLFAAVSSSALAMETFPEQKRRAIWKIAGDVRELGANLLRKTWTAIGWEVDEDSHKLHGFERMGGYQVQFVPELIAPIVELCLSVHASLRSVAVEVLRTMIISTWEIDQELAVIQTAMIDCLDKLCRTKAVTESYLQKAFVEEMLEQFRPLQHTVEDSLYNAVVEMFGKIGDLLGMLASVHQGDGINESTKIMDTLRLMEFLKDLQSEEAYIRYVHQLTELQAAAGNHTEAGLALRLHADRYPWDPLTDVEEMSEPKLPAQTAFERKEALYFEVCQHFEKGQSWQRALGAYKELALQYELNTFDFSKLARAQRAMASIHERIARGDRVSPRYFRVVYRGLGFPISLREKEYIFEGKASDRLQTFEDRLHQFYPEAQIVRGAVDMDGEGQYLQVFAVSPHKDLGHMVYQRTKVSQAAREHAMLSNPQKFTVTTRQPAVDVPLTEQQVEKTIYTTAEPFPTILRRSEIVTTKNMTLSPIEAAIERTTRKTQELLALAKRISSGESENAVMSQLSEALLLSVDPDSDTSVARYRVLLPASEVPETSSVEVDPKVPEKTADPPLNQMQSALKVALLDHALAIRRCLGLYSRSAFLATKQQLIPRFEASFEHELAQLFPGSAGLMLEPSPRSTMIDPDLLVEQQAQAGAQADGAANQPTSVEEQAQPGRRRSSLPWLLKRNSSSRLNKHQANGTSDGSDKADERSHSRQRSRSRLRDNSLTRRLSFFRNTEDKLQDKEGGDGRHLKKRLSFLKGSGGAQTTATTVTNGEQ
ncbi:hypothetical protein BAUCODRAFT_72975 [Baudoinia panamericana UAMH 10762]|uniref:SH3 domain-containing protein n=1 Tax=Baudoinia panamericana (strain UAMH 10762) TaxID=717646 RepID=M2LLA4_BAUPA|nr:uncharacterized protein BAUCODRAFT_72975 [Baudoinia panamericana UAMH 10762]EMC95042.1 hypothetical protein BAUCODRAFT_72975 [Baudoinia panamericana UAMH 10762]